MVAMNVKGASLYFDHVRGIEEIFKTANAIMKEQIESHIQSDIAKKQTLITIRKT